MTEEKFREEVDKGYYPVDEIGYMAEMVEDNVFIKDLGRIYLNRISDAENKFRYELKKIGFKVKE